MEAASELALAGACSCTEYELFNSQQHITSIDNKAHHLLCALQGLCLQHRCRVLHSGAATVTLARFADRPTTSTWPCLSQARAAGSRLLSHLAEAEGWKSVRIRAWIRLGRALLGGKIV